MPEVLTDDEQDAMLFASIPERQNRSVESSNVPTQGTLKWPDMPPMVEAIAEWREPSWFKAMRSMVRCGKHIALSGPPGVGKDTAVIQLAAEEGHPLVTIGGDAGFRRRDLVGTQHIANGGSFLEVGEYAAAVVNGWWVLLTEVNAADADALMFINAQLAAPYIVTIQGKAYPVHPDFRLFVSYNPGLVGTKPLPQSFKDRFFSIQVPFWNESMLGKILVAHGMPDYEINDGSWKDGLVKFGEKLWEAYEKGQLRYQVTTRRLIDAVVMVREGMADNLQEAIKMAVLAAIDSPVEYKVAERVMKENVISYNL
jgi:MoxR-like ATPase